MANRLFSLQISVVFLSFFVMGFIDIVGISINYIKSDFSLSDTLASLIPMMLFLWFFVLSYPISIVIGRIGYKKMILLGLAITFISMMLPVVNYSFITLLISFSLLGIGNTILQVSLNPLVGCIVNKNKMATILTLGQFFKAVSSFTGPILISIMILYLRDWKLIFYFYSIFTALSFILFINFIKNDKIESASRITLSSIRPLFTDHYVLSLFLGILFIVGIDVGLNIGIPPLLMLKLDMPLEKAGLGISLYFAARTIGTFIGAFILLKISSINLLIYSMSIGLLSLVTLLICDVKEIIFLLIAIIGLSCSNVFSILFSKALSYSNLMMNEISSFMIMGVAGGALIIPIMGITSDNFGVLYSMIILIFCMLYLLIWGLYQNKQNRKLN